MKKVLKILWAVIQFPVFLAKDIHGAISEYCRPKCPDCNGTLVFNGMDPDGRTPTYICVGCDRKCL